MPGRRPPPRPAGRTASPKRSAAPTRSAASTRSAAPKRAAASKRPAASARAAGSAKARAGSERRALGRVDGARGQRDGTSGLRRARTRRRRRLVGGLVATVLLVGVLIVAVFPTRTLLTQRASVSSSETDLRAVQAERAKVQAERDRLDTEAEIERRAREELNYVYPDEESVAILPPPVESIGLPDGWPFTGVERALGAG